jgi:16S rRNA G966 N2-methylase RsmD
MTAPKRNIIIRTLRGWVRTALERWEEWRFGVYTNAEIPTDKLGFTDPQCHRYSASNYRCVRQMIKKLKIKPGKDVFIDIGSGLGRVVIVAGTFPFAKVMGVELSKELDAIARENIKRALPKLCCKNIELHCADAREFQIPSDVTVVYFWSPFGESILSRVFANIQKSLLKNPRDMTIVHLRPPEHKFLDNIKHELHWLREATTGEYSSHVTYTIFKYNPHPQQKPLFLSHLPFLFADFYDLSGILLPI